MSFAKRFQFFGHRWLQIVDLFNKFTLKAAPKYIIPIEALILSLSPISNTVTMYTYQIYQELQKIFQWLFQLPHL